MKIQLNEKTLNNYIYKAILNELVAYPESSVNTIPNGIAIGQKAPFAGDPEAVERFQTWFNMPEHFNGNLVIDGIWGKYTQAAWNKWVSQTYPEAVETE